MAKTDKKYKKVKLEDTYAWEGAVGAAAGNAAHWEYKVRSGKVEKLIKARLQMQGIPDPGPAQMKKLVKMTSDLGRGGKLLNGLMIGGLVGSMVTKKSGREKMQHNRKRSREIRGISKKADYIMEKIAFKGPSRRILGWLGRQAKGVGSVAESIAPIIKTTRQNVAKNKYVAPKLKKLQSGGKSFMNWADNPKSFSDPKSPYYITGKKTGITSGINPAYKRFAATNTGRVLGFPIRHPLTSAGVAWGVGKGIGVSKQKEHETLLHNLTNRPSYANRSAIETNYDQKLIMPDSLQTNYVISLPKEQGGMGWQGRPITQKELNKYYHQHNSIRSMTADNIITPKDAASRFPAWYNYDDMDQVIGSRDAMLNGRINDINITAVGKYKNKENVPTTAQFTEAYNSIKSNTTPGTGNAHGYTGGQHDKPRPTLWQNIKNFVGYDG